MATQGPRTATIFDGGTGALPWTNPSYVNISNDSRATRLLLAAAVSDPLAITGFGFAIPAGATILGITLQIERSAAALITTGVDSSVRLLQAGVAAGDDKASASAWPSSVDAVATYGGITDLWGTTWTPALVNASGFGMSIAVTVGGSGGSMRIDYIAITVTYRIGGAPYTMTMRGPAGRQNRLG